MKEHLFWWARHGKVNSAVIKNSGAQTGPQGLADCPDMFVKQNVNRATNVQNHPRPGRPGVSSLGWLKVFILIRQECT